MAKTRRSKTPLPPARGRHSVYRPKNPRAVVALLTDMGHKLLNSVRSRTSYSTGDIFEELLRKHGGTVGRDAQA